MKKYALEIKQIADGEESVIAVDAAGEFSEEGLVLKYAFDGAKYTLAFTAESMVQEREGDVKIFTEFVRGKKTLARISDGQNTGGFEIYTKTMSINFNGESVKAECEFSEREGGEVTRLSVSAFALR